MGLAVLTTSHLGLSPSIISGCRANKRFGGGIMGVGMQSIWNRAFSGISFFILAGLVSLLMACAASSEQQIIFVSDSDGDQEIFLIDIVDGTTIQLTDNDAQDFSPVWTKHRKKIAYLTDESGNLEVNQVSPKGDEITRLTHGENINVYDRLAWSPDGDRLAFVSQREGNPELYVLESKLGNTTRVTFNQARDRLAGWSPNGEWLVFYAIDSDSEPGLWLRNPSGVNLIRLTQGVDTDAVWSPDGEMIAFVRTQDDNLDIYVVAKPDAGTWREGVQELRLTQTPEQDISPDWSPDSRALAFVSSRDGNPEIYTMRADGARQRRLTNNGHDDLEPVWSPDGQKIAFVSYAFGAGEIFVTDADGSDQQRLTNNNAEENSPDW